MAIVVRVNSPPVTKITVGSEKMLVDLSKAIWRPSMEEGVLSWEKSYEDEAPESFDFREVKVKPHVGSTLSYDENGVLNVNTADKVESDNTLPITSAAVAVQVGNIDTLLSLI